MARKHPGVTPLEDDLLTALGFCPPDEKSVQPRLQSLLRVLQRESHHLRIWDHIKAPALFPQQIRNRAFLLGLEPLARGAEARLAGLGQGHALLRWRASLESPTLVRTLSGRSGWVWALALSGDGRVVSGSFDGTVKVWDLNSGQEERTLSGHGGGVSALAVTGDGRVVSGSFDGTVKVWNLNSGQEQRMLSGHGDRVNAVAMTGDGRVVSGSFDGTVKVWNLASGQEQRMLSGHGGAVMALAVTGDGRVVTGSFDGTVTVWDLNSGSCLATVLLDSRHQSLDAKVGADGITLVVGEASGAVSCFRLVLHESSGLHRHGHEAEVRGKGSRMGPSILSGRPEWGKSSVAPPGVESWVAPLDAPWNAHGRHGSW